MREVFWGCRKLFRTFSGFRNRADIRKSPAAGDIASHYGQLTGFPDFFRRKLPHYGQKSDFLDSYRRKSLLTTARNPIFPIFAVEKPHSLRAKMTELYFLPYRITKMVCYLSIGQ